MRRLFLAGVALLTIGATPPSELVIYGDAVARGSLNGVPARIRVDPSAPATPLVTTDLARRAKLKSGIFSFEYVIGPKRVNGKSSVTHIDVGFGPVRRRVGWTDQPYSPGLDGVIGPGLLPHSSVRFQLRARRAGEKIVTLPTVGQGGIEERWGVRYASVVIGGAPMLIQFDPHRRWTLATASAGARIAAAHTGWLSGSTETAEMGFGIERPVRLLKLGVPLQIGPLTLRELRVRTRDHGSARGIAEETAASSADPDEIVVTGKGKKSKGRDHIRLGSDVLERCSSITFDKVAKQLRLSCL